MDFLRTLCLFSQLGTLVFLLHFLTGAFLERLWPLYPLLVLCQHGHAFRIYFSFCFLFLAFLLHLPCLSTYL